ncbi:FG-GAP-like repeat-containing protein [Mitsuaria sp. GD03876]|uniref:FG-GAP-like repeat-containing protein n=1 Tax=Mitsuaria sp. GD03876 TaxID=2975399 RepID=UPI0024479DED|nr:FG-GAP-like repeat-containing protein [Mitsuaria sp. GD03876]MDH0867598.1 FG-GAP-like repeat-containing protein [Mitsuaria sp. GD03876]
MNRWAVAPLRAGRMLACAFVGAVMATGAFAQISVSSSGSPAYSQAIGVPPGIGGMQPNLSLMYAGGGVNGPVGHGWSLQGISMITRCPATRYTDGRPGGVVFGPGDKLCLDGQRLIQTDASGNVVAFPQVDDVKGLSSGWREYRTEKDSFVRVRAYGQTGSDAANGPQYFKVWTKAGQIYEYGNSPSADVNTKASVVAQGKTAVMVWAVARISDVVGNYIDFKYENDERDWGSHAYNVTGPGREWNIREIQYTGNGSQLPSNKVVFRYSSRTSDAAESYQQGSKNVSVRRLDAIDTYINSPTTAPAEPGAAPAGGLFVKRVRIDYAQGGLTGRARVAAISECVGANASQCLPPARFNYATGSAYRVASTSFNLPSTKLSSMDGKYGVMAGDFNGDGRTDLIRWAENAGETQLLQSNGDGSFSSVATSLTSMGALNRADGCISSTVADVNGDGLPDVIRVFNDLNSSGGSCGQTARAEFLINQGSGSFQTRQLLDTGNAQIAFKRQVSNPLSRQFCGDVAAAGNDERSRDLILAIIGQCAGNTYWTGFGWTAGATYYFMDVNGDGRMDIITSTLPARAPADPRDDPNADEDYPICNACTKVYLAQADGRFALTPTNVDNIGLYSDPGRFGALNSWTYVRDTNGDGLADLLSAGAPRKYRNWTSNGDGNFSAQVYSGGSSCAVSLDFNGDGRSDCLQPGTGGTNNALRAGYSSTGPLYVANFNLTGASQGLSSNGGNSIGQNYGVYAIDVNGDGRDDLIRWHDNASLNQLFLSNGDGTFGEAPMSALGEMNGMILGQSDGTYDLLMGDFRGLGSVEFLRISRNAPDLSDLSKKNKLFVASNVETADRLVSYVSPTGLKTTVNYEAMASGRVANDAGTGFKAQYPFTDVMMPGQIVGSLDQESGVGAETVRTEFGYTGMKAAVDGRGLLGFRQTVQQNAAPNGEALSVWTDFLLEEPYAGVAKRTQTRRGAWNAPGAALLSQTENVYCDRTSGTNPDSASVDAPCATTARITRPYLRRSIESGWDLNGTPLPVVTTLNTYNDTGDPTQIVVTTRGTVAGQADQVSTKTTTNTYCAPDTANCANKIAGDNWILGRLSRATVTNSVPKLIDVLNASAGTSPTATATTGSQAVQPPMNPAVLSAILQLLLDD